MKQRNDKTDAGAREATGPTTRKRYVSPQIESGETYERMALACTGSLFIPMGIGCNFISKTGGGCMIDCNNGS